MNKIIALLDDDLKILEIYKEYLEKHEFSAIGFSSADILDEHLQENHVDGFVLDVSFPGDSEAGLHYCNSLRARYPLSPIVILSGMKKNEDIVSGYRMGADNYILKGNSGALSFLVAILESNFRRFGAITEAMRNSSHTSVAPITVDKERRMVHWKGTRVDLSPRYFLVFYALYENDGRVVSKEQLKQLSGLELAPDTMAGIVRDIREAFTKVDSDFSAIQTERNQGYRWLYAE